MMNRDYGRKLFLIICVCLLALLAERVLIPSPLTYIRKAASNIQWKRGIPEDTMKATDKPICSDHCMWGKYSRLNPVVSNMNDWSFSHRIKCPHLNISEIQLESTRKKVYLNCTGSIRMETLGIELRNTSDIHVTSYGDMCVYHYIKSCCHGNYRVPNVVHYVWYLRDKLDFASFLSLLGVVRFIKPCLIIFHGDIPRGHYWDFIIHISPNIIHMRRERPTVIFGKEMVHKEHSGDIMRLEALMLYGGIYMDTDIIIVRPIESLRNFTCVLSRQSSGYTLNAFIMAERNATFLQLWMDEYRRNYIPKNYAYNSMHFTGNLANKRPDLVRIEYCTLSRPENMIGGAVYDNKFATYNWSHIYGVHLYIRIFQDPFNENAIRQMNFTIGSISRHVVYGNKEMCDD